MTIFKLPDLGEGLPDAEIHEWHVKEGDEIKTDQLLVSMETAKAVVDVPSPCCGIVKNYMVKLVMLSMLVRHLSPLPHKQLLKKLKLKQQHLPHM